MEIDETAILKFDFALSLEENDIENGLEEWYGQEGDSYFETSFAQGQSSEGIHFSSADSSVEAPANDLEYFTSVETSVIQQTQYFIDIITIGTLSEEAKATILKQDDAQDSVKDWRTELSGVTESVPTIAEEDSQTNEIIQIIPEKEWDAFDEDGELEVNQVHDRLEAASDSLGSINYNLLGFISLFIGMGGQHIVIPQYPNQVWSPLISIQIQKVDTGESPAPWLPSWVRTLRMLTPYFRSHQWLSYRTNQAQSLDSETYDVSELIYTEVGEDGREEFDSLIDAEGRLSDLRRDWTDVFTQITDELDELKDSHGEIFGEKRANLNEENVPQMEAEVRIPKPQRSGLMVGDTSLLDVYRETLRERYDNLESTLERIERKQSHVADYLHDKLTAKATEANLELQERITQLTWVLIVLTVILVLDAFGVFGILATIASNLIQGLSVSVPW